MVEPACGILQHAHLGVILRRDAVQGVVVCRQRVWALPAILELVPRVWHMQRKRYHGVAPALDNQMPPTRWHAAGTCIAEIFFALLCCQQHACIQCLTLQQTRAWHHLRVGRRQTPRAAPPIRRMCLRQRPAAIAQPCCRTARCSTSGRRLAASAHIKTAGVTTTGATHWRQSVGPQHLRHNITHRKLRATPATGIPQRFVIHLPCAQADLQQLKTAIST